MSIEYIDHPPRDEKALAKVEREMNSRWRFALRSWRSSIAYSPRRMIAHIRRHDRRYLRAAGIVAIICLTLFAVAALLGPVARLVGGQIVSGLQGKEHADAINAVRVTLLQATAGTAALAVLAFSAFTYYLNRRGQHTDRYSKSVALISSEKPAEQVGGIYALEHVMLESPRDHEAVVELLCAFIREHAQDSSQLKRSVQAAIDVLGRRPRRPERRSLDLRQSVLPGADFRNGRFDDAILEGASLVRADLSGASLVGARLSSSDLTGSDLSNAKADHVNLVDALLVSAMLQEAQFNRADLRNINATGAWCQGASFRDSRLDNADFTRAQLLVDFRGAMLQNVVFTDAIAEANMDGVYELTESQVNSMRIRPKEIRVHRPYS